MEVALLNERHNEVILDNRKASPRLAAPSSSCFNQVQNQNQEARKRKILTFIFITEVEIIKHAIKEDGKEVGKEVFFFSWNNTLEPSFSIMAKNDIYIPFSRNDNFLNCYIAVIEEIYFKEGLLLYSASQQYCCTFRQSNSGQVKRFSMQKRIIRN